MSDLSGSDIALIITAAGTLVSALASGAAVLVSSINQRKINEVHRQGNSNALRMEAMARSAGTAEGNLQGRTEQTEERRVDAQERKER